MTLTTAQNDRACGVLLGMAAGDALGAGYEFGPPLADDVVVRMNGGGSFGWAPGEWTDDTSMAIPIAEAAAAGHDLRDEAVLDTIAGEWIAWARKAPDVGNQIRAVVGASAGTTAADLRHSAATFTATHARAGGNGSLMRTAPVALAYLDDPEGLITAATALSQLTHPDPDAVEACVIWSLGIRHAVLTGTLDGIRMSLQYLPSDRAAIWTTRLDEAELYPPSHFSHNGWVVEALQGAWSSIRHTPIPALDPATDIYPCDHFRLSLEAAVRGGRDTDTVAAIAGGLLGAAWGASAVPARWRRVIHGWKGKRSGDLVAFAALSVTGGVSDDRGWPTAKKVDYSTHGARNSLAAHPNDPGVILGGVGHYENLPHGVEAIVSLCRVGARPPSVAPDNHIEVRLIDSDDLAKNPNIGFVLAEAADAVAAFRAEGKTVLLHCAEAISRTPTVAALYARRHLGVTTTDALAQISNAMPAANPRQVFRTILTEAMTRPAADDPTIAHTTSVTESKGALR